MASCQVCRFFIDWRRGSLVPILEPIEKTYVVSRRRAAAEALGAASVPILENNQQTSLTSLASYPPPFNLELAVQLLAKGIEHVDLLSGPLLHLSGA